MNNSTAEQSITWCPRCRLEHVEPSINYALSRTTRDDGAEIRVCGPCGSREAERDFAQVPQIPWSEWPLDLEDILLEDRVCYTFKVPVVAVYSVYPPATVSLLAFDLDVRSLALNTVHSDSPPRKDDMSTAPLPHEDEMMSEQDLADLGILGFCGVIEQLGEEIAENLDPDPLPGWPQQVTIFVANWEQIWDPGLLDLFCATAGKVFPNATTHFVDERGE